MSVRERIGRLMEARRPGGGSQDDPRRLERLEARVAHLESLLEGLQDAVHRDSVRHEQRMSELERNMTPEALTKALSDDARRRGI
jgi:uncharacterized coiled-coil protein SlyX